MLALQHQNSNLVVGENQTECIQVQSWGPNRSFHQKLWMGEQGQAAQGNGKNTEFKTGPGGLGLWV